MREGQYQEGFLALLLIVLAAGIFIAAQAWAGAPTAGLFGVLALLLGVGAYGAWRRRAWAFIAIALAFLALGVLRYESAAYVPDSDVSHYAREDVRVRGVLTEPPRVTQNSRGEWRVRYTINVTGVKQGPDWERASGGLYIYAAAPKASDAEQKNTTNGSDGAATSSATDGGRSKLAINAAPRVAGEVGDIVTASGRVRLPRGYQNPGQLDMELMLKSAGVSASLTSGKRPIEIEPQAGSMFLRTVAAIRTHYRAAMEQVMPRADAAAIFAMLFGGYEGINEDLLDSFTITGIVHILSVSGSHISLLAAVMAALGALLRLPRAVTAGLVVTAIIIYSVLAGLVPPVIRSGIMGALTFMAVALERERDARRVLLITGLVMLASSPLLLFHISFQLSFMATAGLLYLAPAIRGWLTARGVPAWAAMSLAITIAAQLATLPIIAWYYNVLSISSLLANLVVVPLVELMIVVGLAAGILALLPVIGSVIYMLDSLLLGVVFELTRRIAGLPAAQVYIPAVGLGGSAIYYLLLSIVAWPEEWRGRLAEFIRARWQALGVVAIALVVFAAGAAFTRPQVMTMHFIDVGQGDAALAITPHGHALLFDAGGTRDGAYDIGARVVLPYLRHYGVQEIDAIFLTHAHEDHAAGAGALLEKIPVGALITASEGRAAYARTLGVSSASPLLEKQRAARVGESFSIDGVTVEVLFAPEEPGDGNEASNVYRVSYGEARFLITGDIIAAREQTLLASGINPAATALKAPHHGSDTSSSEPFISAIAPRYAIFSVGADNSFGHPKKSVVDRYTAHAIKTYRTDEHGAIVFTTDGKSISVKTYVEQK